MRRSRLAVLLLLFAPRVACCAGLNLGWGLSCPTTTLSSVDVSDACDSNERIYTMVGSVVAPAGLSKVTAEEITADVDLDGGTLPPWWHLEDETSALPAGCRGAGAANPVGSLAVTTDLTGASTAICKNYWGATGTGGFQYLPNFAGMDCGRIRAVFARPEATAGPMIEHVQYYAFKLTLDTRHTVPDPSDPTDYVCAGCLVPACIMFVSCNLDQPPGTPGGDITVATQATRQLVTWQGGYSCYFVSPVRRATWGQIKSLYR